MKSAAKLKDLLLEAGLSEIAVHVYLELLRKPAQTVWELVVRTGLPKTSVYRAVESLRNLRMIAESAQPRLGLDDNNGIRALSLKNFVENLLRSTKKIGKLAHKLAQVAPFLRPGEDTPEEMETLFNKEDIRDAYIKMSQLDYGVNLDFGDFENCVMAFGDLALACRFRDFRTVHAGHKAICTTWGPNTAYFATKESEKKFKNHVEMLNLDFKNRFIIFSDKSDYVFFGDATDREFPMATIVKSKPVADAQRLIFSNFSRKLGNS